MATLEPHSGVMLKPNDLELVLDIVWGSKWVPQNLIQVLGPNDLELVLHTVWRTRGYTEDMRY